VYARRAGAPVAVTYERAACTHGEARSAVEIEGTDGALTWDWLDWQGPGNVHLTTDAAGRPVTETKVVPVDPQITGHDRPLLHLRDAIAGRPTVAVLNEQALFNFSCIRAIYDCAETGRPQQVMRDAEILRT
jgi:predicted dehydrogenase